MKKLFVLFFVLFFGIYSNAQLFGEKKEIVNIKTYGSFDKIQKGSQFKIAIKLNISENWHINSHKPKEDFLIKSELSFPQNFLFKIVNIKYPEGKELKFDFSETPLSVYENEEIIGAVLQAPENISLGEYEIPIEFTYQACNNATCLAPVTLKDTLRIEIVDNKTPVIEKNTEIFSNLDLEYSQPEIKEATEKSTLQRTLESSGILLSLLIVFIGGLALNLTPCVYPLIPITIGYFGSQSEGNTKRLALLGFVYVLGMALTYSVVGVVTAMSGAVFGSLMQNTIVILIVAAVLVGLALSMFDVYEFKLPNSWVMKAGNAKAGFLGAFMMGLTMGIVAAPCIGPFVLGLVTYVAAKGDVLYGFLMFFFMAVGLGTPYLFLAIFSGKIKSLPRAGMWMKGVERIFGFILVGMALYFLLPIFPKTIAGFILPIYAILISLYLLFIDKLANEIKGYRIFKTSFSILVLLISIWVLIPTEKHEANWEKFTETKYETAIKEHKKIVIDFYADWCIPCKELDKITFTDENVIKLLEDFKTLKVDMTKSGSDKTEKIRKQFNIIGMPTIIFINSEGKEIERKTGFIPPEEFQIILKKIN